MVLDACFIVKLIDCFKNTTTELNCGNIVLFVEKRKKLVLETAVPGNLQCMAVGGSLSGRVWSRGGDVALPTSAEGFNKPHFVTLDRTPPSGQTDRAGSLKPSLNNARRKHCVVGDCASFPKKLMSFISAAQRLIFSLCRLDSPNKPSCVLCYRCKSWGSMYFFSI